VIKSTPLQASQNRVDVQLKKLCIAFFFVLQIAQSVIQNNALWIGESIMQKLFPFSSQVTTIFLIIESLSLKTAKKIILWWDLMALKEAHDKMIFSSDGGRGEVDLYLQASTKFNIPSPLSLFPLTKSTPPQSHQQKNNKTQN